ncbi:MAG: amylo-alpha-1,6-glucosidase [Candidatus Obscuribacterales bacterium]
MAFNLAAWLANQLGNSNEALDLPLADVSRLDGSDEREWLITNGLGSYASGTIFGANTRKYHGLLVAALSPPTGRRVLLSRIDEEVNGEQLGASLWNSGHLAPRGFEKIVAFTVHPVPTWCYRVAGGYLIKQVAMLPGEQQTVIGYSWVPDEGSPDGAAAQLKLDLLVNDRDFHQETRGNEGWHFRQFVQGDRTVVIKSTDDALHQLRVQFDRGTYEAQPRWYYNYYWPVEFHRGHNCREDNFHAGRLTVTLKPGESLTLAASVDGRVVSSLRSIGEIVQAVAAHQHQLLAQAAVDADAGARQSARRALVLAADQFLVKRDSTQSDSIIAGYHWFNDWGRDSMISLPGLCLSTGRVAAAKGILTTFAAYLSQGMLPNNFPDTGAHPEYNTSDATFWWAWALLKYLNATGDEDFVRSMLPHLESVVDWHVKGTRYGLRVDDDGLITGGADGVQLTWMDAKVDGFVVTPRRGKAVEINALWYNFLKVLEHLHQRLGSAADGTKYGAMAERALAGFAAFWNADRGCLYDVIREDGSADASIRPNQVIAASLPYSPLTVEQARSMLWVVERELLTPYGLRTLSPYDAQYEPLYGRGKDEARQYDRDVTYHQGTVWPWLLGPWVDARMRIYGETAQNMTFIKNALRPLLTHLVTAAGLGSVSEIFDGDRPHKPQGCIAQAWSIGELLRVLTDYPQLA